MVHIKHHIIIVSRNQDQSKAGDSSHNFHLDNYFFKKYSKEEYSHIHSRK